MTSQSSYTSSNRMSSSAIVRPRLGTKSPPKCASQTRLWFPTNGAHEGHKQLTSDGKTWRRRSHRQQRGVREEFPGKVSKSQQAPVVEPPPPEQRRVSEGESSTTIRCESAGPTPPFPAGSRCLREWTSCSRYRRRVERCGRGLQLGSRWVPVPVHRASHPGFTHSSSVFFRMHGALGAAVLRLSPGPVPLSAADLWFFRSWAPRSFQKTKPLPHGGLWNCSAVLHFGAQPLPRVPVWASQALSQNGGVPSPWRLL